ncbi:SPOR domain-containing protein [bacterium]|nr:SPOR domain-containing protein [bacterium]
MRYLILYVLIFALILEGCTSISVVKEKQDDTAKKEIIPEEALVKPPVVVAEKEPGEYQPQGGSSIPNPYSEANQPSPGGVVSQLGWRVQLFNTDKKVEADDFEKQAVEKLGMKIYNEYEPPYYKIRVGNCETPEEAEKLLEKVKENGYKNAWIVQCRILIE